MSAFTDFLKDLFGGAKKSTDEYEAARRELESYVQENSRGPLPEKVTLPETPKYERLEYESKSDDELASQAEKELADYYNSGKNGIDAEIDALMKKYDARKTSAANSANEKTSSVYAAYSAAKENTANDVLKRGLARSSIAALRESELDESAAKEAAAISKQLYDTVNEIDGEIADLGVKREKALSDFNIAYASKLTAKIGDLKSERDKKLAEALKYNNSLSEKEYKQEVDRKSKESDLYTKALSQKKTENELKKSGGNGDYSATYERMRNALSKLDPSDARKAFAYDPIYRDNLNDYYYYKLYDEFGRR